MQGRKDFRLRLRAGVLTLELVPSLGGAVSAFRLETRAGPFDLFRSLKVPEGAREDALHAGCFPMVPFANCIRDNRFGFEGRRYAVSPNMAGSRLNFHGSGWQSAWQVAARALDRVELRLGDGRVDGVYRYEAVQLFELDPRALTLTTTLRNRGERAMPFSFGQHPWFPRHGGMLVRFRAGAVLGTDAEGGALSREPIAQDADYSVFRSVPAGYRNQCYAGWTGKPHRPRDHGRSRLRSPDAARAGERRAGCVPGAAEPGALRFRRTGGGENGSRRIRAGAGRSDRRRHPLRGELVQLPLNATPHLRPDVG